MKAILKTISNDIKKIQAKLGAASEDLSCIEPSSLSKERVLIDEMKFHASVIEFLKGRLRAEIFIVELAAKMIKEEISSLTALSLESDARLKQIEQALSGSSPSSWDEDDLRNKREIERGELDYIEGCIYDANDRLETLIDGIDSL